MVVVQPQPGVRFLLAGLFRFPVASEGPRLTLLLLLLLLLSSSLL